MLLSTAVLSLALLSSQSAAPRGDAAAPPAAPSYNASFFEQVGDKPVAVHTDTSAVRGKVQAVDDDSVVVQGKDGTLTPIRIASVRQVRLLQRRKRAPRRPQQKTARLVELNDDIRDTRERAKQLEEKAAETRSSATNYLIGGGAGVCGGLLLGVVAVPTAGSPIGWGAGASSCTMLGLSVGSFVRSFILQGEADDLDVKAKDERQRLKRLHRQRETMQY